MKNVVKEFTEMLENHYNERLNFEVKNYNKFMKALEHTKKITLDEEDSMLNSMLNEAAFREVMIEGLVSEMQKRDMDVRNAEAIQIADMVREQLNKAMKELEEILR